MILSENVVTGKLKNIKIRMQETAERTGFKIQAKARAGLQLP